ncbi:MAG: MarR family transcriptional regulator [Nocardioidaceae bacterium]|jgi:DNA-binding MarR family transcriptional regulator|nr:MarR family transcriptional regulator [Nocardioidaceae bacterium]
MQIFETPSSPEEAVIGLLMQAGRRLRTRHPEDEVDPSSFPLAKRLMCGDAMRVSDLAGQVELDASTVSRQIKQLEYKGILERTPDPGDGRASLVRLTDDGRATMEAAFRRRRARIRAVLDPWSERDRAQLQKLLTRLASDLRVANDLDAQTVDIPSESRDR